MAEETKDSPDTESPEASAAAAEPLASREATTASSSSGGPMGDDRSEREAASQGEEAAEFSPADPQQPASGTSPPSADQPDGEGAEPEVPPADPLEVAEAEAARWKDKCLRTAADFDNFRKRSRRDVDEAGRRGGEDLLKELLPVFDNLDRAVSVAETATDVQSLADGIRMVMRQFMDTLAKLGVERVPSVGEAFDPALHEAIQHLATPEHPPGTVAAEVQAGYRRGERLVRPALVVVAKAPESPVEKPE